MSAQDFTTTITVDQTPEEVFNAIANPRAWWSEDVEGGTAKLNDEFIYRYKDVHFCKVRLIEVIPGKKFVRKVVENRSTLQKTKLNGQALQLVLKFPKRIIRPSSFSRIMV